ncbi:uncharacterized protein [Physcomitrium patens]|uniref:uncharacterized protein n=1 Tax=Physcomitrium patens TaxID=3218 RepID=UPI000D1679AA|nr:increased DNA methylation 1-like [Physcomitrium patens]|eukprot:XP_024389829.1 increased DNA methylation 1-like [Physcomitrella patens]
MGAQRSPEEDVDDLDIVVDISRDSKVSRTAPSRPVNKETAMDESDSEPLQRTCSSSGTTGTSVGTHGGSEGHNQEVSRNMMEENNQESLRDSPVKATVDSARKMDSHEGDKASPTNNRGPSDGRLLNGVSEESDTPVKQKTGRKRKKTVHYRNSRVPHAIPTLESESDKESDSSEKQEGAEELPSRSAPGSRSSASKLKAMVPIGNKLTKPPRNAKELMATGLLEGHYVHCSCRGEQLTGIFQDMGVVCNCRICKGTQVVSISAFEAHSGSTSHHPSDNIYLENGKNLRDILSAGQESADCGDNILRALQHAIGEIQGISKEMTCVKCGKHEGGEFISCKGAKCSAAYHAECVGVKSPHLEDWFCAKCEKTQARKPQPLLKVKRSPAGTDKEDARSKGKEQTMIARSARDAHLHKALFLPGGLADGTELGYYARNQCILKGVKQGGGICCSCCNQEITCSAFERHARCEARQNPYGSILLADGRSLKDMCKELADQSKLGNRAIQVPRNGNVKPCPGCGKQGDLESCQGCKSAWCPNCANQFSGLGQKIPCKISQLFEKLLAYVHHLGMKCLNLSTCVIRFYCMDINSSTMSAA